MMVSSGPSPKSNPYPLRLNCNFCRYSITVPENLLPWATGIITKHAETKHFTEIEKLKNAQSSPSPSVPA